MRSEAALGIIASTFIYESVIRHGPYLEGYSEIPVQVKESSAVAWMKLFDRPPSLTRSARPVGARLLMDLDPGLMDLDPGLMDLDPGLVALDGQQLG